MFKKINKVMVSVSLTLMLITTLVSTFTLNVRAEEAFDITKVSPYINGGTFDEIYSYNNAKYGYGLDYYKKYYTDNLRNLVANDINAYRQANGYNVPLTLTTANQNGVDNLALQFSNRNKIRDIMHNGQLVAPNNANYFFMLTNIRDYTACDGSLTDGLLHGLAAGRTEDDIRVLTEVPSISLQVVWTRGDAIVLIISC